MKRSKDARVQKLLEEIEGLDVEEYNIMQNLREIVFCVFPQVKERIMYGGILFTIEKDFGGIFASKKHVSFEFTNGFLMNDPEKKLEGTGKFRRHLKIKSVRDIEGKKVEFFVKQAAIAIQK